MSEAKPYTETEAWAYLQAKLAGHKEWLHAQAIMRVEIAPVNVGGVRDLVDALEELARVGIEVEADLASLRADYEAAIRALDRLSEFVLEDFYNGDVSDPLLSCVTPQYHAAAKAMVAVLSTPRAKEVLGR